MICFPISSLGSLSAALFNLGLATLAIRERLSGVGGGLHWASSPLLEQKASLRGNVSMQPAPPFLFSAVLPSSDLWVGFDSNCISFGLFPAHLMSATCSPMEQRNIIGCPERSTDTSGRNWEQHRSWPSAWWTLLRFALQRFALSQVTIKAFPLQMETNLLHTKHMNKQTLKFNWFGWKSLVWASHPQCLLLLAKQPESHHLNSHVWKEQKGVWGGRGWITTKAQHQIIWIPL